MRKITEKNIEHVHAKDIYEWYHLVSLLSEKEIFILLDHLRDEEGKVPKEVRRSLSSSHSFIEKIKEEVIKSLTKEYIDYSRIFAKKRDHLKDPLMIELKLIALPEKLKLLKVSFDRKGYYGIQKLLHEIKNELS